MLLIFLATVMYALLYLLLRKRSKNVALMSLAASVFMLITLIALITRNEFLAKVQVAATLSSVVFGVFMVSYISIGNNIFSKILTASYLGLWIGGACMIWRSTITIEPGILFFSLTIGNPLWLYIVYVFFYPGMILSFFLFIFGLDNIESKYGLRIMGISILASTLGFSMYFSVTNPMYGLMALLVNLVWTMMFFIWEVLY